MATPTDEVKVLCSCVPGFEQIALQECKEKLDVRCEKELRGRLAIYITSNEVHKLTRLRAINHFWVVVGEKENIFTDDLDEIKQNLTNLPDNLIWESALDTWKSFKIFQRTYIPPVRAIISKDENKKPKLDEEKYAINKDYNNVAPISAGENLTFRVSSRRTGKHIFNSVDVDRCVGAGINDKFNWKVDLTNYDIKVVAYVLDNSISLGIQLTEDNQSLRNITHFGPTNLRANISYCLLKMADIHPGDVVCDPMCGGASIGLEGALAFPESFHIAGDNHEKAVENAGENYAGIETLHKNDEGEGFSIKTVPMNVLSWDVYHLPLRTASIDCIITDLPFGKKIGSRERNLFLYPKALSEMARVCRLNGKAVLLTQHKQAMWKAVSRSPNWKLCQCTKINMGGLNVNVYLLKRTEKLKKKTELSKENISNLNSHDDEIEHNLAISNDDEIEHDPATTRTDYLTSSGNLFDDGQIVSQ